jgi:hypothetical protein
MSFVHRPRGMERRGFHCGFHYMAAPGVVGAPALERLMIQSADAVVFLPRRDDPAGAASRKAFESLVEVANSEGATRNLPVFALDYCDGDERASAAGLFRRPEKVQVLASPGDTAAALLELHTRVRDEVLRGFEGLSRERVKALTQRRASSSPARRMWRSKQLSLVLAVLFAVAGLAGLAWWLTGQM